MDIVFLGSGAFGIPSLNALAASGHRILHVISQPDRPAGRGKLLTPTAVSQWAIGRNLPLTRTENANASEVLQTLRTLKPACLVVIAFGQKMSDELLGIAPLGGINLHSSLLPKYRGAAPINWAVINNDEVTGVSVIAITSRMDAGDIFAQSETLIGPAETAGELHDRLADLGAPLLPRVLDQLEGGTAIRESQDEKQASRAPKLSREIAWVDFVQPAPVVSARIRGMSPWPGVQVEVMDAVGKSRATATIVKCRAGELSGSRPLAECGKVLANRNVACGTGTLEILSIQPVGKKPMDLAAFSNGYGYGPGARLKPVVVPPGA